MSGVIDAYRRVLRNVWLRRLLAGEVVSATGDWLYLVAILVLLYQQTEDPVLLGILGAARVAPYMIFSIPAGIVADRFDRRMVLIITDLARGALMVVLAALVLADADVAAIVAVAIGATCFSAFFGPAIGAYLPSLIKDESDLGPANTAYATLNEITFIIGPAIGALILAALDLWVAFALNAVTFVVVAAVLWTLPSSAPVRRDEDEAPAPGTSTFRWRESVRPLSALAVMDGAGSFVFGGVSVLTVVIAFDLLGAGEAGTGLLNAAVGVGGLIGSAIVGVLVLRRRLGPPVLFGAVALGVGVAVLGVSGSMALSMLAIAAAAVGGLLTEVIYTTLLQRIAPDEVRGRAFGVMGTVDVVLYAAGSFCIPAATVAFGLQPVLLASGIGVIAVIAVSTLVLGEWATQEPPADEARAVLASVSGFSRLAPARLESAQRRASVMPMAAGAAIITQGEEADRFYVIVEGEVEVTQVPPEGGEATVLRRMGRSEAFGEIGLLSGVPRTATVTAVTDGVLLALDREAFLDLVADESLEVFPVYGPSLGRATARLAKPDLGRAGSAPAS